MAVLKQLKGVGTLIALTYLLTLEDAHRFHKSRDVGVDPYQQDFFKELIEQRKANEAGKTLKHAIKVIANATAYEAFVELNGQREPRYKYRKVKGQKKRVREFNNVVVSVHSGNHEHTQQLYDLEVSGEMYFPPLASLITSGGRLLLAIAEVAVTDAGGVYMACDTDSIMMFRQSSKRTASFA